MSNYNDSGTDTDRKEVGQDVKLQIDGNEYPITNVNIDEEADTSETQLISDSLPQKDIAVTGLSYSGSFEVAGGPESLSTGVNNTPREDVFAENDTGGTTSSQPLRVSSITITDQDKQYNLFTVVITSTSKDMPADDRTTRSFDFTAEDLQVNPAP